MLKTFKNVEKKATIAVIEDCSMDAVARIGKVIAARNKVKLDKDICKRYEQIKFACRLVPNSKSALMSESIKAIVTCDERDTYDEAVGEREAVKKAIANHKRAFLKALKRWQVAMLKDVIAVSPETFKEALNEVMPCECRHECGNKTTN